MDSGLEIIGESDRFYLEPAGLVVKEGFAVVAESDVGGDVYDVTDPFSPVVVDGFTVPTVLGSDLADSVVYFVNGSSALGVARIGEAGFYSAAAVGAEMMDVAASGGYAFVTSGTGELIIAFTRPARMSVT